MSRSDTSQGATVSFSIDLELAIGLETPGRQERLAILTGELLELLENHRIPATWGVSDPARSAARDGILGSRIGHEIAVLGDSIWLGNAAMQSRLEKEFERRFEGARKAGLPVSTLVLRNAASHLNLNLLLSHRITAVRGPAMPPGDDDPRGWPVRFGIWQIPSPLLVSLQGGWWKSGQWTLHQRLDTALQAGRGIHLVLDAGTMVDLPGFGLAGVASLLARVAKSREFRRLQVSTISQLSRKNLSRRTSQPSRSVLRPAA